MRRVGIRWAGALPLLAAALGVALVAGASPSAAQVPNGGGPTGTLTLQEAVDVARRANPQYRQAEAALDLNGVEQRATLMSQVLPSVDVNLLRTGYGGNLTRRATDFFGNPIENPTSEWVYNSNTSQGLTLNWSIRGTSILDALSRQSRTSRNRVLQLGTRSWQLESEVRRLYFDALEQRELVSVEEAILESREVDFQSAERLFAIAQRSRVDVLTAELQVEQQRQNVQRQRRLYDQARLALASYLGEPELAAEEPADEPVPLFDPAELDADALVEESQRWNPALEEARGSVAGARIGIREARQSWWPNLNVSYSLGRLAQTRESEAFFDLGYEENDLQSSFSVFVSLPVLNNYFQDRANEAEAQVNLVNQEETLRERRIQVEQQVRTELINLDNQYRSYLLASRSLEIASQAVRLAREEYRLGTRTFEQLQEAVTQEADARRQVIQARFGFMDSLLALEENLGRRLEAD